jgi:hypothetical protein
MDNSKPTSKIIMTQNCNFSWLGMFCVCSKNLVKYSRTPIYSTGHLGGKGESLVNRGTWQIGGQKNPLKFDPHKVDYVI